jgi:hypothetical protein
MINLILIIFLVIGISSLIVPLFYGDKVNSYVKKNKGTIVSSEFKQKLHSQYSRINREIVIKYKDQNNNLREVTLHYFAFLSSFGDDKIIKYSTSSPEYAELKAEQNEIEQRVQKEQTNYDTRALEFDEVEYKLNNQEILTIRQEYPNPNIGEFAYINNIQAPNGKYKIGLFTHIYVENGRIVDVR